MNALHHQPSLELPSPKKSKMGEFVPGNNKFGSKGTIRCRKCQQRKGKCSFEHPEMPCDYCFARGLECGPKLPTPRKLAEWGRLVTQPLAIAQPHTSCALSGQLNIQIPVTVSGNGGGFNLSSANSDTEMPFGFPSPTQFGGHRPYSAYAGFASLMNPVSFGITMPTSNYNIVQTWSPQQESSSSQTSPEFSSAMTSPEEFIQDSIPVCPCIPPRHPAHTLNASILPIISSAIPSFPSSTTSDDPLTEEKVWELYQNMWLELDGRPPTPAPKGISVPVRLRWNRLLSIPRSMRGRKLAGKWDDEKRVKTEEFEGVKSIKTAPSILC